MQDPAVQFVVAPEHGGERLDRLVARHMGVSRREARTLIATGCVSVNRRTMRILTRPVRAGAAVAVAVAEPHPPAPSPEGMGKSFSRGERNDTPSASENASRHGSGALSAGRSPRRGSGALSSRERSSPRRNDSIPSPLGSPRRGSAVGAAPSHAPLEILYLDRWLVAVNKPARLLSEHDRFGSPSVESLLPKVLERRGEHTRLWLVHRLDAGTSGVLVLARTPGAAAALNATFREARAQKTYLALCTGELRESQDVDAPVGRAERTRHQVRADGKPAQTRVTPLAAANGATLVQALPRTGRTHQIRVHMAHLHHPLLGDRLYGGPGYTAGQRPMAIGRAMLHAQRLALPHPKEDRPMVFTASPPDDFVQLAKSLGLSGF